MGSYYQTLNRQLLDRVGESATNLNLKHEVISWRTEETLRSKAQVGIVSSSLETSRGRFFTKKAKRTAVNKQRIKWIKTAWKEHAEHYLPVTNAWKLAMKAIFARKRRGVWKKIVRRGAWIWPFS